MIEKKSVTVLCPKLLISRNESDLQWLIGSQFFRPRTIISTFRCIHTDSGSGSGSGTSPSPDYSRESEDIRALLPKGFEVIGALVVGASDQEKNACKAIDAARRLRVLLFDGVERGNEEIVGAVADSNGGDIRFFVSNNDKPTSLEHVTSVLYEENPDKFVWDNGCLLRCQLPVKIPVYFSDTRLTDAEKNFLLKAEEALAKFKDPKVSYIVGTSNKASEDAELAVILRGTDFDLRNLELKGDNGQVSGKNLVQCAEFCPKSKFSSVFSAESADIIQVTVLLNRSEKLQKIYAPVAQYFPAMEDTKLVLVDFNLEVLCYATKSVPISYAVSKLVIPALADQLNAMKKTTLSHLLAQHPQLHPYHFCLPGLRHPITVIYELNYGETEMKQVEVRKSLHLRLGLPFDRPLLRIANALDLSTVSASSKKSSNQKGSAKLKDVHMGIPSSGVSGGSSSLVQGSYEYYHYLQNGYDDSGWGCAYRSLQTIISWFRLQHYTSVDVPSHREIQEALVDIGDKDPSFIGSREWIGAIELSFVLDKLLGVSCKVINVRSGAELPEKCRELALHFETQGTPVMIGGGVLAYTLLGVDYNEASGDCAFLILDPHYTGSDDLKKIVNGGWCGWKKAVDSKGKSFFLHDKFYNLLLPQRPNMV